MNRTAGLHDAGATVHFVPLLSLQGVIVPPPSITSDGVEIGGIATRKHKKAQKEMCERRIFFKSNHELDAH